MEQKRLNGIISKEQNEMIYDFFNEQKSDIDTITINDKFYLSMYGDKDLDVFKEFLLNTVKLDYQTFLEVEEINDVIYNEYWQRCSNCGTAHWVGYDDPQYLVNDKESIEYCKDCLNAENFDDIEEAYINKNELLIVDWDISKILIERGFKLIEKHTFEYWNTDKPSNYTRELEGFLWLSDGFQEWALYQKIEQD